MLLSFAERFSQKNLPVQLYYTASSSNLQWHSHDFLEIALLFDGEATYETDFSSEKITKGDVLFVPMGGTHRYRNENNVLLMNILFLDDKLTFPYEEICLHPGFSALFRLRLDYYRQMKFYPKVHLNDKQLAQAKNILLPAWENQEEQLPGATLGVYGAFLQIIPILLAAWDSTDYPVVRKQPVLISEAISKMNTRFREKLFIPDLAREAGMSESSFARHFKQATGETPVEYLLKLRLQDAATLIGSGMSVSEAAYAAGFSDSNYFSRIFKQKYGVSPRDFKKIPK